jgi:hypothetical protein
MDIVRLIGDEFPSKNDNAGVRKVYSLPKDAAKRNI